MPYTLETHLEINSRSSEEAKSIYSIWNLNKHNLKKALDNVIISFPHYSLHNNTHSDQIIKNIEYYLGEDRIKELTVTDTWMILMAAYTHDIGMVVLAKQIQKKFEDNKVFIKALNDLAGDKLNIELSEAAKSILQLYNRERNDEVKSLLEYPLKIKKAITIVNAELFRKIHHEQSRDILKGLDDTFQNEYNKFYSTDIPVRFLETLGDIAYCHGIEFYDYFKLLKYKSNGFCNDYMHPRFIGAMLRLGDLLDVDDKRFNEFSLNTLMDGAPQSSLDHKEKHASIRQLLITPSKIEIEVDSKEHESAFRLANQWFDMLRKEVDNLNKEWNEIKPEYLSGLAPIISRDGIKVLFKGMSGHRELLNLRFNISQRKVFEMFQGAAIYDKPEFVFLREIVQNSIDASKIQMWNDIEDGKYDYALKNHLKIEQPVDTRNIIKEIKLPEHLPSEIVMNYPINLSMNWTDEKCSKLIVEITDRGTGISKNDLLRISNNVGESKLKTKTMVEELALMPFFLQPTGAFGIGLQSLFMVTNEFRVLTKSESDQGWSIIFRNRSLDNYISVTENAENTKRGTKLSFSIDLEQFDKAFGNSFDTEIVEYYDPFKDPVGSPYLHKVRNYVQTQIPYYENMKIQIVDTECFVNPLLSLSEGTKIGTLENDKSGKIVNEIKEDGNREVDLSTELYMIKTKEEHDNKIVFKSFENNIIGSELLVAFCQRFPTEYERSYDVIPSYPKIFQVRNVDIDEKGPNYYCMHYLAIKFNLLTPSSDKILNISRDKFISTAKREMMEKFVDEIFDSLIININELFISSYDKLSEIIEADVIETIQFHIQLSLFLKSLDKHVNYEKIRTRLLPRPITEVVMEDGVMQAMSYEKFFDKTDFLTFKNVFCENNFQHGKRETNFTDDLRQLAIKHKLHYKAVWHEHLDVYLRTYTVAKIIDIETSTKATKGLWAFVLKKGNSEIPITASESFISQYFKGVFDRKSFGGRWSMLLPFNKYSTLLVKDRSYSGFEKFHNFTTCSIISPFRTTLQLESFIAELNEVNEAALDIFIAKYPINELVNENLIRAIYETTIHKKVPSENEITSIYTQLIRDIANVLIKNE